MFRASIMFLSVMTENAAFLVYEMKICANSFILFQTKGYLSLFTDLGIEWLLLIHTYIMSAKIQCERVLHILVYFFNSVIFSYQSNYW